MAENAQKEKLNCSTCLKKQLQRKEREGRDRDKLGDQLEAFLTRKEEEDEATGLMEEMRKNVVAVQSLCNALREYVDNYGRDQDQARTLMTKCWQSMQSRGTKNMNLEKDLEDIHSTARRVGGNEEDKTRRLWTQDEGEEQKSLQP